MTHLPHLAFGQPLTDEHGQWLMRCWEVFNTPDLEPNGQKIDEAWLPASSECFVAQYPSCLVCVAMGPGPDVES